MDDMSSMLSDVNPHYLYLCSQISQWSIVRDSRALHTGVSVGLVSWVTLCELRIASVTLRRLSTSNVV